MDSNRLLVVTHPVLAPILRDEIEATLPLEQRKAGWDIVEIAPLRTELSRLHEVDWAAACADQHKLIEKDLLPALAGRRRVAYFGYAPIPLALHLGYRLERRLPVDVYQRHDVRGDWARTEFDAKIKTPLLRPLHLPDRGSDRRGPVVIRVSGSFRIDRVQTAPVVPEALAEVDIALTNPGKDTLREKGALTEVSNAFEKALSHLRGLFPQMTAIHLFVAAPVGLTFRLGTQITPSIYPEVVTYQYWTKWDPPYRRAIVLTPEEPVKEPVREAPPEKPLEWTGHEIITGSQETFLDISFLHEGVRVAAGVARVNTLTQNDKSGRATAFVIAKDTLLTNFHVLFDEADRPVKQVDVWLNYELDTEGRLCDVDTYEGDVSTIIGEKRHDWAIVRVKRSLKDTYPILRLGPSKPVCTGDYVFIVQHPKGDPKKIGLLHNQVVHVSTDAIQYLTDTLPGSSGSPVLNERWQVVALHRRGVEASGTNAAKNEGVPIERVVAALRSWGVPLP